MYKLHVDLLHVDPQTTNKVQTKPEAKLPKSIIISQRNCQSREGFPSDITQLPTAAGGFHQTCRNTRSAVKLN